MNPLKTYMLNKLVKDFELLIAIFLFTFKIIIFITRIYKNLSFQIDKSYFVIYNIFDCL